MKKIKIMPDYYSFPVWNVGDSFGNIDPKDLSLSKKLITRLMIWARKYDSLINLSDPNLGSDSIGFPTAQEEKLFLNEGIEIYNEMKKELGEKYDISFYFQGKWCSYIKE